MPYLRAFKQVDVFTTQPYLGNALAVVLDGVGLSDEAMQHFAAWTNLSETTFLLPPTPEAAAAGADYQVRIFTTGYEMPFAGHPTLGSCQAWLEAGGIPRNPARIVQQCKVGLVPIRRDGARLAFATPALERRDATASLRQALPDALGVRPQQILATQHLNNGPHHFGVLLDSMEAVWGLQPQTGLLQALMEQEGFTGLGVAARQDAPGPAPLIARSNREARAFGPRAPENAPASGTDGTAALEVRFLFSRGDGIAEDPITGSFNASLAQWLIADGHMPTRYVAAQGGCIGRAGRVFIERDASGQVWVGGDSATCIHGNVIL